MTEPAGAATARPSVLVIDDEPSNVDLFTRCLRTEFAVASAKDGASALELLKHQSFEVILSDQRMPGMTGIELLAEAEKLDTLAARVLVTAYGDMEVLAHAVNDARIAYYVRKPWDPEHLREVVRRFARDVMKRRAQISLHDASGLGAPLSVFYQAVRNSLVTAGERGSTLGLICADIDRLRETNARLGVEAGELLIKRLTESAKTGLGGHASVASVHQGGRLLAMAEATSIAELRDAARALRTRYGSAEGPTSSVSVGLSFFPRDGKDALRLVALAEEAVARAKRLGRDRVVECLPVLVVLGQLPAIDTAIRGLASRMDLRLISANETEASTVVARERPSVVLAHLLGSRVALGELSTLLKLEELKGTEVVLATSKEASAAVTARASAFPHARLLWGKQRLVARIVESVCHALGVKQRRHLRVASRIDVSLLRVYDDSTHSGQLVNVSESGAKVGLAQPLVSGEPVRLKMSLDGHPLDLSATVVRTFRAEKGWELGLEFNDVTPDDRAALAEFIGEGENETHGAVSEPPREFPRHESRPILKLKVRVRPAQSKQTYYLKPINFSKGGTLLETQARFDLTLGVGDSVDLMLFAKVKHIHATGRVVRREAIAGGRCRLAVKFERTPSLDTDLAELLDEAPANQK